MAGGDSMMDSNPININKWNFMSPDTLKQYKKGLMNALTSSYMNSTELFDSIVNDGSVKTSTYILSELLTCPILTFNELGCILAIIVIIIAIIFGVQCGCTLNILIAMIIPLLFFGWYLYISIDRSRLLYDDIYTFWFTSTIQKDGLDLEKKSSQLFDHIEKCFSIQLDDSGSLRNYPITKDVDVTQHNNNCKYIMIHVVGVENIGERQSRSIKNSLLNEITISIDKEKWVSFWDKVKHSKNVTHDYIDCTVLSKSYTPEDEIDLAKHRCRDSNFKKSDTSFCGRINPHSGNIMYAYSRNHNYSAVVSFFFGKLVNSGLHGYSWMGDFKEFGLIDFCVPESSDVIKKSVTTSVQNIESYLSYFAW